MDTLTKEIKMGMRRTRVKFLEELREWILSGLFYTDNLVLCGELEEDLKVMVERFIKVCKRRGLKINVDISMVLVLSGGGGIGV